MVNVALAGPNPPRARVQAAEKDGNMVTICTHGGVSVYPEVARLAIFGRGETRLPQYLFTHILYMLC